MLEQNGFRIRLKASVQVVQEKKTEIIVIKKG